MMSDDIPVVGIIVYFHIYIVSNTKSPATCFNGHVYM